MGFRETVIRALRVVREKGEITPERLAFELGRSPTYVRYSIVPALREISPCVNFNKMENKVKWICEEESVEAMG